MSTTTPSSLQSSNKLASFLADGSAYALVSLGALMISAQLRLKVTAGAILGDDYAAHPPILLLLLVISAAIGAAVFPQLKSRYPRWARFFGGELTAVIFGVSTLLFVPEFSQLQLIYLGLGSTVIGLITLRYTPAKYSLGFSITALWQNRTLLALWVRYNVLSRYSQTILGILWIVMLPVANSLILTFVFSYIFSARDMGNVPFISFFLTGLMFWTLFMQTINNGTVSIIANMGLINQIYFPREILVLVKLGEALVDLSFVFVVTLLINLMVGVLPNINYAYLPILLLIQLILMMGITFFNSYLTVLVRDLQQLTTVFLQMMFYLTPIMYPIDILSPRLAELVLFLNPMASLINAYRDVMVYNRAPDFVSLYFPMVLAGVLFYSGYMFFKANERRLADFR